MGNWHLCETETYICETENHVESPKVDQTILILLWLNFILYVKPKSLYAKPKPMYAKPKVHPCMGLSSARSNKVVPTFARRLAIAVLSATVHARPCKNFAEMYCCSLAQNFRHRGVQKCITICKNHSVGWPPQNKI